MKKNIDIISEVLNSVSPFEARRVETKMMIASKISKALKEKGWRKKDLMKAMGKKNPSEITRWLSGTHNFTSDLLSDLSLVLGINLLNVEEHVNEPVSYIYQISVKSTSSVEYNNPFRSRIGDPFYHQRLQVKAKA